MANYYVRKTGNDTTGDGSTGNPWLTISKALATVSLAGGHTIYVGAGTYAEDTSGTKYLYLNRAFSAEVAITAEAGASVIITDNASGTYTIRYVSGTLVAFVGITITQAGSNTQGTIVFQDGTSGRFANCSIEMRNYGVFANLTGAATITLENCTIAKRAGATGNLVGVYCYNGAGGYTTLTVTNCTIAGEASAIPAALHVAGAAPDSFTATVTGGTFTNTTTYAIYAYNGRLDVSGVSATSISSPAVVFGSDGVSAAVTTGSIENSTVTSTSSHALLIGYGAGAVVANNNIVNGGDYGVVIKMNDGATVTGCTINGGSSATVYCKGALNATITGNTLYNSAGVLMLVGLGDSGQKSAGITFTGNALNGSGTAALFNWDDADGDAGGSVCDYNIYAPRGSGSFGSVYGTASLTTLDDLRTAWDTYDEPDNDDNSRLKAQTVLRLGAARSRGLRVLE